MLNLHADLKARMFKIRGDSPWLFLLTLYADVTTTAQTVFRLVSYPEPVTFDGDTYDPFPMKLGVIEEGSDGDLPRWDIEISNVTRELAPWFETGAGFLNREVLLKITTQKALATAAAKLELRFRVADAVLTHEAARLTLGPPAWFDRAAIADRVTRNRCRWPFRSEMCGYRGPELACNFTLTRCNEIGADEESRGFTRLHPRRYGAFPSVPKDAV